MYTLIFMSTGDLPWGLYEEQTIQETMANKEKLSIRELCEGRPGNFAQCLNFLDEFQTAFQSIFETSDFCQPDYEFLLSTFSNLILKN